MSGQGPASFEGACPTPHGPGTVIEIAHGGGGRRMHELLGSVFLDAFGDPCEARGHDGAVFGVASNQIALTTDSYVVQPLEFPGGDIGSLAVHGTVNDLLMCGARPGRLAAAFVLEAGLEISRLKSIVASMRRAADASGVTIVTGDTKVVQFARGDGLSITTTGIGEIIAADPIGPASVRPGDAVIVSGDLGRHGVAVMSARERLEFETPILSDSASLGPAVLPLLESAVSVHCLRDLTRGGLASALVEIASAGGVDIEVDESRIPVRDDVRGACELLGLDPLYVANEGRCIAIVEAGEADRALELMHRSEVAADARVIGRVSEPAVGTAKRGLVTARTQIGSRRVIDMLSGEQLPRIC